MTESRPIDVVRCEMPMPDTGEIVGVLIPKQRWLFDRLFAEGGDYTIEIHVPRSTKSHNHYFAAVHEAWKNLPEELSKSFVDSEHLRKWALIKTGWAIERSVPCPSAEVAASVAAALSLAADESAVIIVHDTVVTVATARSQKERGPGAMNREDFQKSKQDVLDYVAGLIGVDPRRFLHKFPIRPTVP